jgi:predicted ester cyclase
VPIEEYKASVRRIIDEVWNKGDLEVLDELYAADVVHHRPPFQKRDGLAAFKHYILATRRAYPDMRLTIDAVIVEGQTTVIQWTFHGIFIGRSPVTETANTGTPVTFTGCTIAHEVDGHIVESWEYTDHLGLMQQLDMILPLEQDARQ